MLSNLKCRHRLLGLGIGVVVLFSGSCGTGLTTLKDEHRFLFVLSDTFSLASFEYHERTRSIELKTNWGLPASSKTLAVSPDQKTLLVGSTTALSYYRIGSDRHDIGEIYWKYDLANLSYPISRIVFHPEKDIAYVIESNGSGSLIRAVQFVENQLISLGSASGPVGQFLSALVNEDGSWVYTAYSGDTGLYRAQIDSAGSVSGSSAASYHFSTTFEPGGMKLTPDGFMVSVKLGSSPGVGWSHELGSSGESSGTIDDYPTSLAIHPEGEYAYVASSGTAGYGSALSVYSLTSSRTFDEEKQSFDMGDSASTTESNLVVIDSTGKNLFFSHCTMDSLTWFVANDSGSELEVVKSDFGAPDMSCPLAMATASIAPD